ncbi:hypothetical protein PRZ48_010159 [Zasmidium cellare]|uniref:Uncharacterized protein n=1 Tax=Zasmidium cellare TaxID=395010 RepID=A0ABR0EEF5_ZASCE|nr:hypothetical protein PRZ48_010159 [Zasmidium cellare]
MSPPTDTHFHEQRITEAFVDLGFNLTEDRKRCFYQLCFQYYKLEGRRKLTERARSPIQLSYYSSISSECAYSFIDKYGKQLWPTDMKQCYHLTRQYVADSISLTKKGYAAPLEKFERIYAHDALGNRVQRYFELLDEVPVVLHPDFGEPSLAALDALVQRVLDTTNDPKPRPPTSPPLNLFGGELVHLETSPVPKLPSFPTTPSMWGINTWQVPSKSPTSPSPLSPGYGSSSKFSPTSPTYSPRDPPWYSPTSPLSFDQQARRYQAGAFATPYAPTSPFARPPASRSPGQPSIFSSPSPSASSQSAVPPTTPYPSPPYSTSRPSAANSPSIKQSQATPSTNQGQRGRPSTNSSSNRRLPGHGPTFGSQGKSS